MMTVLFHDTAHSHSLCVSESRYATAVVIISRTFRFSKGVDIVLLVAFETYRGRHHIFFALKLNSLEIGFRISNVSASAGQDFNFIPNDTANIPAETKLELWTENRSMTTF